MTERVDVCIVGSGFGASISAWRLAELYRAAGEKPSIVVLERGLRKGHTDFAQSMDVDHLSQTYELIQGQGLQVVVANLVGGGSNLYLAASLRAPSEIFERTDVAPDDGPRRRVWPKQLSRIELDPYYARAEAGLRVAPTPWDMVSKSGGICVDVPRVGLHLRPRPARDKPRALRQRQVVLHGLHLRGQELPDHQLPRLGPAGRGRSQTVGPGESGPAVECEALPLHRPGQQGRPRHQGIGGRDRRHRVQGPRPCGRGNGNAADPHALPAQPSLPVAAGRQAPGSERRSRRGDRVQPGQGSRCPRPAAIRPVLQGPADHGDELRLLRRQARPPPRRHPLHAAGDLLSQLTNFLYDDGRKPEGAPSWWGLQKKRSISTWSDHIEILAMVEDTNDGAFYAVPPDGGGHVQPNGGPVGVGLFDYTQSEQSMLVRKRANEAIRQIAERRGVGKFLKLTETEGVFAPILSAAPGWRRARRSGSSTTETRSSARGPLLHRQLGGPHEPRGQPVADDRRRLRARRGPPRAPRPRLRPAQGAEGIPLQDPGRACRPARASLSGRFSPRAAARQPTG